MVRSLQRSRRPRIGSRVVMKTCLMLSLCLAVGTWAGTQAGFTALSVGKAGGRNLLSKSDSGSNSTHEFPEHCYEVHSEFPPGAFTDEELRQGYIGITLFVMFYMFYGLAFVCDNYFEDSLEDISVALHLSDDVAGATFMAMGSSAPELVTSMIGTLSGLGALGVSTIVGSAVFNVLIIIGLCGVFAPGAQLSWYPLVRDGICYGISIIALFSFLSSDGIDDCGDLAAKVPLSGAIVFLVLYLGYILIMAFNEKLEEGVVEFVNRNLAKPLASDQRCLKKIVKSVAFKLFILGVIAYSLVIYVMYLTISDPPAPEWMTWSAYIVNAVFFVEMLLKMRAYGFFGYWRKPSNAFDGMLVLLILFELTFSAFGVAKQLRALKFFRLIRIVRGIRFVKDVKEIVTPEPEGPQDRTSRVLTGHEMVFMGVAGDEAEHTDHEVPAYAHYAEGGDGARKRWRKLRGAVRTTAAFKRGLTDNPSDQSNIQASLDEAAADDDDDDDDDEGWSPCDLPEGGVMSWVSFALTFPLCTVIWFSMLPCTKFRPNWYLYKFFVSILHIVWASWVMVWMVDRFVSATGAPVVLMGLTLVAAGTSVPDTLASVHVAMKGKGNMAVSNSIGSNIFDILVGLGLPWLVKILNDYATGSPEDAFVSIKSNGLAFSTLVLFVTVGLVLCTIHYNKFLLDRFVGWSLLIGYFLFILLSYLTEMRILDINSFL